MYITDKKVTKYALRYLNRGFQFLFGYYKGFSGGIRDFNLRCRLFYIEKIDKITKLIQMIEL